MDNIADYIIAVFIRGFGRLMEFGGGIWNNGDTLAVFRYETVGKVFLLEGNLSSGVRFKITKGP